MKIFLIVSLSIILVCMAAVCVWFLYLDAQLQGKRLSAYLSDWFKDLIRGISLVGNDLFVICQKLAAAVVGYLQAENTARRLRRQFDVDLWCPLDAIIADYRYNKLGYDMWQSESGLPAYIFIHFYTQQAMTEERAQELLWHLTAAFRQYLAAYGLSFAVVPTYYISNSEVTIYLYYCEYPDELPLLTALRDRIGRSGATPGFGTLKDVSPRGKNQVILGYSADAWTKAGAKVPYVWNFHKVPHLLIAGPTGGGKSVCAQLIVRRLLRQGQDITFCDFKAGGDWRNIGAKYAEYGACDDMLNSFFSQFAAALEAGTHDGRHHFLLFDEFSSYALSKDSKDFKALMAQVAQLALMGRTYGYHLIFISQQPSAKVIDTAIREQFGIRLYMGATISTESAGMLFPGVEIDKGRHLPEHVGYIATPEKELDTILIPEVDPAALKAELEQLGRRN